MKTIHRVARASLARLLRSSLPSLFRGVLDRTLFLAGCTSVAEIRTHRDASAEIAVDVENPSKDCFASSGITDAMRVQFYVLALNRWPTTWFGRASCRYCD